VDLKEFIQETISGIVDAALELQKKYEDSDILINPPTAFDERNAFRENSASYTYRRVETVEFDVAVSATSESAGGGKAALKILSVEAGVDGTHKRGNEEVSRVKFSIAITLSPSNAEAKNQAVAEAKNQKFLAKQKGSKF
jgi:hypothetical protein